MSTTLVMPPASSAVERLRGRASAFADLPIRRKLFLTFVLLDLLVLAGVGLFFPVREWRDLQAGRAELTVQGRALADMVGATVAPALDFGDTTTVSTLLRQTTERFHQVSQAAVYVDGSPVGHAGSSTREIPALLRRAGDRPVLEQGGAFFVQRTLTGTSGDRVLVLEMSQADVRRRFLGSLTFAAALSILFLLAGGVLSGVASRGIVTPIAAVLETVDGVAQRGHWDLTLRVPEHGTDEPGRLAAGVNRFIAESASLIAAVKHVTGEVSEGSTEIRTALATLSDSANALNDSIGLIANTAEQSADRMRQNLTLARETSTLAGQARASAESAGSAAAHVVESSRRGREVAERARKQMSEISGKTVETRRVMDSLRSHSKHIDQIVEAIRGIAQQTNLLALNAAIEAARAGEHGRGFAVVADEVRKLADQAAAHAGEIGGSIEAIRRDIETAVLAVEQVDEEVGGGADVIASTAELLRSVVEEVEGVASDVGTIASLTVKQQDALSRVTESAAALTKWGDEQAASAAEMSATVEEQTASTNELSSAADGLNRVVRELQTQIERIRI